MAAFLRNCQAATEIIVHSFLKYFLAFPLVFACSIATGSEKWQAPDSPYRMGEAYPEVAATCETANEWIKHAPETDERVSFAITGKLVTVQWDGALAYLVMCEEDNVQVLCVTYSADGREVGEVVTFGGGYSRAGEKQIVLDPCLASNVPDVQ
jgi:hypothetical protein